MINASELELALAGTLLEGRAVHTVDLADRAGSALVVDCESGEVLEVWTAARSVLEATGRWPVVVCSFGDDIDIELPRRSKGSFGGDAAEQIVHDIGRSSHADSIGAFMAAFRASDVFAPIFQSKSQLRFALDQMEKVAGRSPTESDVRSAIGAPATDLELERFLLDWELANGIVGMESGGHMEWFEPDGLPTAVVFLPTPHHFETVAHLDFFGAGRSGEPAALGTVLQSWNERFGAELVAHFGTMLGFVVERPPGDIDTAFELACEHAAIAECTLALPGVSLRDHARSLIGRDTWFLHERP